MPGNSPIVSDDRFAYDAQNRGMIWVSRCRLSDVGQMLGLLPAKGWVWRRNGSK